MRSSQIVGRIKSVIQNNKFFPKGKKNPPLKCSCKAQRRRRVPRGQQGARGPAPALTPLLAWHENEGEADLCSKPGCWAGHFPALWHGSRSPVPHTRWVGGRTAQESIIMQFKPSPGQLAASESANSITAVPCKSSSGNESPFTQEVYSVTLCYFQ